MVDLRPAHYPGTISIDSEATIKENFEKMPFNQIIEALTKPVESSENDSRVSTSEDIICTGTIEEVNELFRNKRWTDGLAIIPPTKEKVEEFLKYVDRSPHEQIAILPVANLGATPWSIAVNGVMAGCRPECMPVLVAAVEAIGDPHYNLSQIGTTAGVNTFFLINGPIIKKLGFEYGTGVISRGPNPAIGRALGLIIRNIAGFLPAEQYMGTFGYIMPFVLAEDEEGSPWEPFHVEHGFGINTSTVTAGGTFKWGPQIFPSGTDSEGLLKILCRGIAKTSDPLVIVFGHMQMATVVINPSVAQAIAHGGYSKQDVEKYLFENSRATIEEVNLELKYGDGTGSGTTIAKQIELGFTPKEWLDRRRSDDTVTAILYPGLIHIVVCGDPVRNKAMVLHSVYTRPTTKEIKLPADWA
ncbi:hypothetical protein ACFLWI_01675 [Chloroflexota bacterium]